MDNSSLDFFLLSDIPSGFVHNKSELTRINEERYKMTNQHFPKMTISESLSSPTLKATEALLKEPLPNSMIAMYMYYLCIKELM